MGRAGAPNLADLEVAKRNQASRKEVAMTETTPSPLGNVITIDDDRIKNHLDRVVLERGADVWRIVGRRGGSAVQCATLRAQRSPPRYPAGH